ncbi:hypothetical protein QA601_06510 [Chitinispirillales bacterium ANBcel5]|uniref:hypothetical protein n=1 Tax=Cellulosispirillum alkaliphilum TaxID=3039283 RepID=UPI002A508F33|nr:hypothetical protein [Chitinispirillales bacterium ANBcel5]
MAIHFAVTCSFLVAIAARAIPITTGRVRLIRELCESSRLEILHPTAPDSSHLNNSFIVARVINGTNSFLFTVDARKQAETEMLNNRIDLQSTVLSGIW